MLVLPSVLPPLFPHPRTPSLAGSPVCVAAPCTVAPAYIPTREEAMLKLQQRDASSLLGCFAIRYVDDSAISGRTHALIENDGPIEPGKLATSYWCRANVSAETETRPPAVIPGKLCAGMRS
eukprot:2244043-Rhodomonas_salina.1